MLSINGFKIVVSPDRPRMQLSPDCPVSDDFRAEINEWMRVFFGYDNLLRDGSWIITEDKFIHMNPRTFERLKEFV